MADRGTAILATPPSVMVVTQTGIDTAFTVLLSANVAVQQVGGSTGSGSGPSYPTSGVAWP